MRGRVIRTAGIPLMALVGGFVGFVLSPLDPYSLRGVGAMFLAISAPLYLLSVLLHKFGVEEGQGDSSSETQPNVSRRT